MEDVDEPVLENGSKTAVFVRSSRALSSISDPLLAGIKSVINKNVNWSEEEKQHLFERLREVYESCLQENVALGKADSDHSECKAGSDDQTQTADAEPVDERRKDLVNSQLLPLIHERILNNCSKRKTEPFKIARTLARRCKQECILARRARASKVASTLDNIPFTKETVTTEDAKRVALSIADGVQSLPNIVEGAEHLQRAIHMEESMSQTRTCQVLCQPFPWDTTMPHSLTPICKRLEQFSHRPLQPLKRSRQQVEKTVHRKPLRCLLDRP